MENKGMLRCVQFLKRIEGVRKGQSGSDQYGSQFTERLGIVHDALLLNPNRLNVDGVDRYLFSRPDTQNMTYGDRVEIVENFRARTQEYREVGKEVTFDPNAAAKAGFTFGGINVKEGTRRDREAYVQEKFIETGLRSVDSAERAWKGQKRLPFDAVLTPKQRRKVLGFAAENLREYGTIVTEGPVVKAYLSREGTADTLTNEEVGALSKAVV